MLQVLLLDNQHQFATCYLPYYRALRLMFARTPSCLLGSHVKRGVQSRSADKRALVQGLKVMRVFSGSLLLYVQVIRLTSLIACRSL